MQIPRAVHSVKTLIKPLFLIAISSLVAACSDAEEISQSETVRGLRVYEVTESAASMVRRYPTIVQPAEDSRLSFEISGQLGDVTLEVGEIVKRGDILLQLDPTSLNFELQQSEAALEQAEANLSIAQTDFARKSELLKSGNVTQAAYDSSENSVRTAEAQVAQSRQQLRLTQEKLKKADLKAPFDGVISSIDAKPFATVSPGNPVLSLYSQAAFEVEFSVPATIINALNVGAEARVAITDVAGLSVKGRIKEIGSRATQVSAFPVVVALEESNPFIRAGMSAEVGVSVSLAGGGSGILVPIEAFVLEGSGAVEQGFENRTSTGGPALVFVYNPETSTVHKRVVQSAGVRGNELIIAEGLEIGELVARAGVSYLHEGQKVKLLPERTARLGAQ